MPDKKATVWAMPQVHLAYMWSWWRYQSKWLAKVVQGSIAMIVRGGHLLHHNYIKEWNAKAECLL